MSAHPHDQSPTISGDGLPIQPTETQSLVGDGDRSPTADTENSPPLSQADESAIIDLVADFQSQLMQGRQPDLAEICKDRLDLLSHVRQAIEKVNRFQAAQRDVTLAQTRRSSVTELPHLPGFEILGVLGRGGMGIVYRAVQSRLGRVVALKMVLDREEPNERQIARFLYEAEAMASVQHPQIAQIFESGEYDGRPYLVMELLERGSLAQRWKDNANRAPRDVARIMAKIGRGVAAAHLQGIVHRDLKPGNVLFDSQDEPKVTDFGLAKGSSGRDLTATEATIGTPAYMSPEQARGETRLAGAPADVWALGVMLYEGLTGKLPFHADSSIAVMDRIVNHQPTSPREVIAAVPRDIDVICLKCLRKEPHRRYPSAKELADDLERFLNDEPIQARPVGPIERAIKWSRRHPARTSSVALISLGIVVAVIFWTSYQNQVAQRAREKSLQDLMEARSTDVARLGAGIDRSWARDRLRGIIETAEPTSAHAFNAALFLGPTDPLATVFLTNRALLGDPDDIELIQASFRNGPCPKATWWELATGNAEPMERLAAAALLAECDAKSPRWPEIAGFVIEELAILPPGVQGEWANLFREASPALTDVHSRLLRESTDPKKLDQYIAILGLHRGKSLQVLGEPWPMDERSLTRPETTRHSYGRVENDAERSANVTARTLVLGLREGNDAPVWRALRYDTDPRLRSHVIHELGQSGVQLKTLVDRFWVETDDGAKQGILLAIGDYEGGGKSVARRELVAKLEVEYRTNADPGLHSAISWLARRWGAEFRFQEIDRELVGSPVDGRRWYVAPDGTTYTVFRAPIETLTGTALQTFYREIPTEREERFLLTRDFAVATSEFTAGEFDVIRKEIHASTPAWALATGAGPLNHLKRIWPDYLDNRQTLESFGRYHPGPRHAMGELHPRDCMIMCRWLSEKHGVPEDQMCYPSVWEIMMRAAPYPDYLDRTGYRMPTEVEWEHAARAGSRLNYAFASNRKLGPEYGWAQSESFDASHPVGLLKPNMAGLHDVHGNVFERCHGNRTERANLPFAPFHIDTTLGTPHYQDFVIRGGSFARSWLDLQLGYRWGSGVPEYRPELATGDMGFRICRTIGQPPVVPIEQFATRRNWFTVKLNGTGKFRVFDIGGEVEVSPMEGTLPATVRIAGNVTNDRGFGVRVSLDGTDEELHLWSNSAEEQLRIAHVKAPVPRLRFVLVPAGSFTQGTEPTLLARLCPGNAPGGMMPDVVSEAGTRRVTVSRPFSLSETEISMGSFTEFARATNYQTYAETTKTAQFWDGTKRQIVPGPLTWTAPGYAVTEHHPVSCITYADAAAYCKWLSAKLGGDYTLPTEAEWEHAARAGSATVWPMSDSSRELARYCRFAAPVPIAPFSLRPNAWGLFDMLGNVAEVVTDQLDGKPFPSKAVVDPKGLSGKPGLPYGNRGGGFDSVDGVHHVRPAWRGTTNTDIVANSNGFRVRGPAWEPKLTAEIVDERVGKIYDIVGSAKAFTAEVVGEECSVESINSRIPGRVAIMAPPNRPLAYTLTVRPDSGGRHATSHGSFGEPQWHVQYFRGPRSTFLQPTEAETRDAYSQPAVWSGTQRGELHQSWTAPDMPQRLPSRFFMMKANTTLDVPDGKYEMAVFSGAGCRVYVDDLLVCDTWQLGRDEKVVVELPLKQGKHDVKVEAYQLEREHQFRIRWRRLGPR